MVCLLIVQGLAQSKDWGSIIESASKSPLGILALLILVVASLGMTFFRKAPAKIKLTAFLGVLAGAIGYGYAITQASSVEAHASYEVRVMVVDAQGVPVGDAKVTSSIGGESMKVDGGWLFSIGNDKVPADHEVRFSADRDASFAHGSAVLKLTENRTPTVTVAMASSTAATVFGMVEDQRHRAVAGAAVSLLGPTQEHVTTSASGGFSIPAHAAESQKVELHAEKTGYAASNVWCAAGKDPCQITLKR
jgi:hypothetical protein